MTLEFLEDYYTYIHSSEIELCNANLSKLQLMETDWYAEFMLERSADVDAKKLNGLCKGSKGKEMLMSRFKTTLKNRSNSMIHRMTKNLLSAMRYLSYSLKDTAEAVGRRKY